MIKVAIIGVVPPRRAVAVLYPKPIPVYRRFVGNILAIIAGRGP
jgi:hypothetical protein